MDILKEFHIKEVLSALEENNIEKLKLEYTNHGLDNVFINCLTFVNGKQQHEVAVNLGLELDKVVSVTSGYLLENVAEYNSILSEFGVNMDILTEKSLELYEKKLQDFNKIKEDNPKFQNVDFPLKPEDFISQKKPLSKKTIKDNEQLEIILENFMYDYMNRFEEYFSYFGYSQADNIFNEYNMWTLLRKISGLSYDQIVKDNENITNFELAKLENRKTDKGSSNINREVYFNYLLSKLKMKTNIFNELVFHEVYDGFILQGFPINYEKFKDIPYPYLNMCIEQEIDDKKYLLFTFKFNI